MKFWFVCQGKSFSSEEGMKYLWAPLKDKRGASLAYWDRVKEVKRGDIIFNYSDGLKGISIAENDAYPFIRQDNNEQWSKDGTRVDIKLFKLDSPISYQKLQEKKSQLKTVLGELDGPFDKDGKVKQGYLFEFNAEAGSLIRNTIYKKNFPVDIDSYFDKNLIVKEKLYIDMNHLSCKTKPFIILAGISGTGKSRLVRKLAYQFNNIPEDKAQNINPPSNYQLIKVKPNWHDSSEVLGYESRINGECYVVTEFVKFIVKAWQYPQTPFFLCLDEMNLAPVEQYFAEYLSVVETREWKEAEDTIQSDDLISKSIFIKFGVESKNPKFDFWKELQLSDDKLKSQFISKGLTLPPNLIVMGTVNMDETTHSFSRKVLDRAMTIEMNQIDLKNNLETAADELKYPATPLDASLVLVDRTHGHQVYDELGEEADKLIAYLEEINKELDNTPFRVAYRVRDEFLLYAYNYMQNGNTPVGWLDAVMDDMTCMKILPRIEGDEEKTAVLKNLINLFEKRDLKNALAKAKEMEFRRTKYHYTSFWN